MKPKASRERKRRSDAIHEQIEALRRGAQPIPVAPESPAAFVHRRMRELAEQERLRQKSAPRKPKK